MKRPDRGSPSGRDRHAPSGANLALGGGAEFDAIRDLLSRWGEAAEGIGDDAALLVVPRGEQLVVSVDACVEGTHFKREWLSGEQIGYRATAAALSDLAAMAARPIGILFAVNMPAAWRNSLGQIADGVARAARAAGARIIGGNISSSTELSITTTVLGSVYEPLRRAGAAEGDRIYVTGALGGPGAAVAAWGRGQTPAKEWLARFANPSPRLHEARWLADRGATSCIDISDGLIADAGHIASASARRLEVDIHRLPLIAGVTGAEAARSGEEYELLITGPGLDRAEFESRFGLTLTEIGKVASGPSGVTALNDVRVAAADGHDHFSS